MILETRGSGTFFSNLIAQCDTIIINNQALDSEFVKYF